MFANDTTLARRKRITPGRDALAQAAEALAAAEPTITIPFPPDLFEALARRVAEVLSERPPVQRYLDSEAAAAYLGIPAKTLKTKEWRDDNDIPYGYIGGRLLFDRLALDERFASCSGDPAGSYTVARVAATLAQGAP